MLIKSWHWAEESITLWSHATAAWSKCWSDSTRAFKSALGSTNYSLLHLLWFTGLHIKKLKNGPNLSCWAKHGFNNNTVTIWQSSWLPFATSEISTFLAPCVTFRLLSGAVPLVKWSLYSALIKLLPKGRRLKSLIWQIILSLTWGHRFWDAVLLLAKRRVLLAGEMSSSVPNEATSGCVMSNC